MSCNHPHNEESQDASAATVISFAPETFVPNTSDEIDGVEIQYITPNDVRIIIPREKIINGDTIILHTNTPKRPSYNRTTTIQYECESLLIYEPEETIVCSSTECLGGGSIFCPVSRVMTADKLTISLGLAENLLDAIVPD